MKDKLQEYALIAEIIGTLAIIISLIFLGIQIKQNTDMMRAQIRDAISDKQVELYLTIGSNKDAMDLYTKGRAGLIKYNPNDPDFNSWQFLALANLRDWENEWYQYDHGLFSEKEYKGRTSLLYYIFSTPGYKEIWKRNKQTFSTGFRMYIDSLATMDTLRYQQWTH